MDLFMSCTSSPECLAIESDLLKCWVLTTVADQWKTHSLWYAWNCLNPLTRWDRSHDNRLKAEDVVGEGSCVEERWPCSVQISHVYRRIFDCKLVYGVLIDDKPHKSSRHSIKGCLREGQKLNTLEILDKCSHRLRKPLLIGQMLEDGLVISFTIHLSVSPQCPPSLSFPHKIVV